MAFDARHKIAEARKLLAELEKLEGEKEEASPSITILMKLLKEMIDMGEDLNNEMLSLENMVDNY